MSRTRYIDYRAEDSTELLNNQYRGVFEAGVYLGFNVSTGTSGGFWLAFSHDTDPDNTGEVLGVLVTHDGVTIQENEDQDDVCVGAAPGGSDEIHWVVASYTYNKALPNNDVVYFVKTAVAPATPTLTDDEVQLAEITVPAGSISYGVAGVDIKTVAKKSIYDINLYNLFSKFDKILDPGIYDGMVASQGATELQVSLSSGVWITQQNAPIVEAAQADVFTLTNPGNDSYKYAWIVGMHKNEDLDPQPSVDYLLVQGTAVAIGSQASLPSNSDILTAASAVDAKYDDNSYINKLGYIRIENQSGTYVISYYLGETVLDQETVIVYGAETNSLSRSGKYYGDEGLKQAIEDIYAISKDRSDILNQKYTVLLDGVFKLDDTYLTIPSNILLRGYGAPATIESDEGSEGVVRAVGFNAIYNAADDTVTQTTWGGGSPPSGYVARNFEIASTYRVGEDLVARKLSIGDPIIAVDDGTANVYQGTIQGYETSSNNWTVRVYISDQYNTDGNPQELDFTVYKRNFGFENVDIGRKTSAGTGALVINYAEEIYLDKVTARNIDFQHISTSVFSSLEVTNDIDAWESCAHNTFGILKLVCPQTSLTVGSTTDEHNSFDLIDSDAGTAVQTLTLQAGINIYGKVILDGGSGSKISLDLEDSIVKEIVVEAASGEVETTGSNTSMGLVSAASTVTFLAGAGSQVIDLLIGGASLVNNGDEDNKVLSMPGTTYQGFLDHANSDRNLRIMSNADLSWDLTTGVFSWSDVLRFDIPWTTGYSEIAAGSATLSTDGDRLVIDVDRDATGVSAATTSVVSKASAATNAWKQDLVFVAVRYGDTIYLFDGTRIEDTQTVQIGSTPPPDGSVTHAKLGGSALAFHNEFFRDYISLEGTTDWPSEAVVLNTDLRTMTYTIGTGVIQYSDTIDLSNVRAGDMVILSNNAEDSTDCWTREEIYDVDNVANQITISSGLNSLVEGAATVWNGAIVRGDMAVSNYSLSTTAYDRSTGRVTFTPGLNFSDYQVKDGYVFVDNAGKKHVIRDHDTTGNGTWVDIGVHKRDVSVGVPADSSYGSIRVNNNPHGINTADLRASSGMEFIPIDWFGQKDRVDDSDLTLFVDTDEATQWYYPEPRDDRVRVSMDCQARGTKRQSAGHESATPDETSVQALSQHFYDVDVTAVCTGAMLVVEHISGVSSAVPVYVDGDVLQYNARYSGSDECANTYTPLRHFHSNGIIQYRTHRLPLGVHNIRWRIPQDFINGKNPVSVRGIVLFTAPGSDDEKLVCSPGTLVRDGGVTTISDPEIVDLPSSTEDLDKGGRSVLYLNTSDALAWASQWVRGFSGTGTTASGPDIVSVSNPDAWRIGDLMLLSNGTTRYIHVVTVISGSTITVSPNAAFTQAGATLRYYGHVPYDSANDRYDRPEEEVTAQFNFAEFACGGSAGDHRGSAIHRSSDVRTVSLGVRLSDHATILEGSVGFSNTTADGDTDIGPFDWLKWPNNGTLRLRFIGTGLSLAIKGTTDLGIRVDGVTTNLATLQSSSTRKGDRIGGTYVIGELPYGYHFVDIIDTSGAADQRVQRVTIFGPKKPTLPDGAFELLDTNIRGATDTELGFDVLDEVQQVQFGNINYDAGAIVSLEILDSLSDSASTFNSSIGCKDWNWSAAGAPASSEYEFMFIGKEFTIVWDTLTLGDVNPIDILVKDHDGVFRAPSAVTGFTVTGVDTVSSTSAIAERETWTFSQGGVHVIRIAAGNVGDQVYMNSAEFAPKLHNYRTKKPYGFEHYMPYQHSGLDVRNLTPIPAHLMPVPHYQHIQFFTQATAITQDDQVPFFFYCPGGMMEIGVAGKVDQVTSATTWSVLIDGGYFDDFNFVPNTLDTIGTGGANLAGSTLHIVLPPGMHWAILMPTIEAGADELDNVFWSAKFIPSGHPNHLSNRGILPAVGTQGRRIERSY